MAGHCRRGLATLAAFALGVLVLAPFAGAQSWISFTNETTTRLIDAEGNYPGMLTDPDEKDFAVGDLDNDGDSDMIVVRKQPYTTQGKRKNYLFLNESGVLTNRTQAYASQLLDLTNDRDVEIFDADGDGWLDVVTATTFPAGAGGVTTDPPSIYMPRLYMNLGGDPDGNWLGLQYTYGDQRIPDYPNNKYPFFCSVEYGDVDNDGDLDLWFTDYAADTSVPNPPAGPLKNRLLLNNGSGFYTDVSDTNLLPLPGQSGYNIDYDIRGQGFGTNGGIADMNGDGWLDIVATDSCSADPRTLRMTKNLGPAQPGMFQTGSWSNLTPGLSVYHYDFGDLNHDNKLDMYQVDDGNDRVFINNGNNIQGNPTFTGITIPGQSSQTTGTFGGNTYCVDMDNDGWLDQVVCDEDVDLADGDNRMVLMHNIGVSPWLSLTGNPFTMDGTLGTRDTFDAAIIDINGDGLLDLVVGTKTANKVFMQPVVDTTAPTVISTTPSDGAVDHLQDRGDGGVLQGVTQVTIKFSEAVRDAASNGPVSAASFVLTLTSNLPGLTPPTITSVTNEGNDTYRLTFNQPITPGAWLTITASVEDLVGNPIGANALDVGYLPADVNGDLTSNTVDLLNAVNVLNTCAAEGTCGLPENLIVADVNRDDVVSTLDLLRTVQLLNGVNTQNVWNGVSLPPQP